MFGELSSYLQKCLDTALDRVQAIDADQLLSENETVLVAGLLGHLPDPVRVLWESATRSEVVETTTSTYDHFSGRAVNDIPSTGISIYFPIEGSTELLTLAASTRSLAPTRLSIIRSRLNLHLVERRLTAQTIENAVAALRREVDQRSSWGNRDLLAFRSRAEQEIGERIRSRRERLLADRDLSASLSIPIESTANSRPPVPAKRRHVPLASRTGQGAFIPEPVLDAAIFRDIIGQVESWARSLERTSGTLARLHEEELRDLILAHLNAYWQGAAGGELFNGAGKTDILIRHDDRNVFIAECKIWSGPSAARNAIDQLLTYLVWRDSKAALVMFIRTKDPAATVDKLLATIANHDRHVMTRPTRGNSHGPTDFILTADAEGRRVTLSVIPVIQTGM